MDKIRVISKDLSKTVKSDLRIERLGLNKIFHIVFLYVTWCVLFNPSSIQSKNEF